MAISKITLQDVTTALDTNYEPFRQQIVQAMGVPGHQLQQAITYNIPPAQSQEDRINYLEVMVADLLRTVEALRGQAVIDKGLRSMDGIDREIIDIVDERFTSLSGDLEDKLTDFDEGLRNKVRDLRTDLRHVADKKDNLEQRVSDLEEVNLRKNPNYARF